MCEMDASEAAKVIIDKISRLEPEHVAKKIMGFIYFKEYSDQEMIRIALGPDSLIHNLIQEAKNARLLALAPPAISSPISQTMNPGGPLSDSAFQFTGGPFSIASPQPISAPAVYRRLDGYWDPQIGGEPQPMQNSEFNMMPPYSGYLGLEDQLEAVKSGASGYPNEYYFHEAAFSNMSIRGCRNSSSPIEYPVKTCHYFNKGFCKHGSNCRYFHGESFRESYPLHIFGSNSYDLSGDDQVLSPGTLEKLELEITELLKSRNGNALSIASLPMMYYERYGKNLQAEGYLTESQRHGKAGYSLTKLLSRLKNSIRLIDRPHGQHAVILAVDAPKYMDLRGERNEPGHIVSGSRQIYLTFPAESTFSEEDVSNYFSTFGQVQDVRIPCQQKRMFGFVTFVTADTVNIILSKGNPHYVCGARVLVKPYREKSKLAERKYIEKLDHNGPPIDIDSELQSSWESSRMLKRQLFEEHNLALELEAMRFSQLQLSCKPAGNQSSYFDYSMNELKLPEDHSKFPSAERFNHLLDVLNNDSTTDNNPIYPVNNFGDQESTQGFNLPDSPFASTVPNSISAVM